KAARGGFPPCCPCLPIASLSQRDERKRNPRAIAPGTRVFLCLAQIAASRGCENGVPCGFRCSRPSKVAARRSRGHFSLPADDDLTQTPSATSHPRHAEPGSASMDRDSAAPCGHASALPLAKPPAHA